MDLTETHNHYNGSVRPLYEYSQLRVNSRNLSQPLEWFYNGMNVIIPSRHSSLEIAYVVSDSVVQYHSNLSKAWVELLDVTRLDHTQDLFGRPMLDIPLLFPLLKYTKEQIMAIYQEYFDILKLVWVCEKPIKITDTLIGSCKNCTPCKSHRQQVLKTKTYKMMRENRKLHGNV